MLRALSLLALPILLGSLSEPVSAGGLAETARGIDNKSSSDSNSSSSSNESKGEDSSGESMFSDNDYNGCLTCDGEVQLPELVLPAPSFDLRLSAQKVFDSDGSLHFDTTMDFERGGLYASFDHYFETIESSGKMAERSEDVRIDLFELAGFARLASTEVFSADLRFGFALAASSHFDTLPGGVLGFKLSARANDTLALSVEARAMRYTHEISAMEAAAGAQISYAWLGYRALKFDVGPVLEGPEAGLQFHF